MVSYKKAMFVCPASPLPREDRRNRSSGDFRNIKTFSGHPGVTGDFVGIITQPAHARDGTSSAKISSNETEHDGLNQNNLRVSLHNVFSH